MIEVHKYDELLSGLRKRNRRPGQIVVLDGAMGSGKTYLAMQLAKDLDGCRISSDCYLIAGTEGPYTTRLATDFIADDVFRLRKRVPVILFEGICARDILAKLGLEWAASVYVKRIATTTLWHFGYDLEDFRDTDETPEPSRSDLIYHRATCPHERADFVFVRTAD